MAVLAMPCSCPRAFFCKLLLLAFWQSPAFGTPALDTAEQCATCSQVADVETSEAAAMRMSLLQQHNSRAPGRLSFSGSHGALDRRRADLLQELTVVEAALHNDSRESDVDDPAVCWGAGGGPASSPCEDGLAATVGALPHEKVMTWRKLWGGHQIPNDEGPGVAAVDGNGNQVWVPAWQCTSHCGAQGNCNYVIVCGGTCYLKGKKISVNEPSKRNNYCDAYVYTEASYQPNDPALLQPSGAEKFTFYMYRSQGPSINGEYPLQNVNTATIGAALWYLHNEVVSECRYGNKLGARKFHISRLRRFKVTVRPTKPLKDKGLRFGVVKSFDSGEATGPHRNGWVGKGSGWNSQPEWEQFGFHVGCGVLGDFPHAEFKSGKRYPDPVWYSLPGACPETDYRRQSKVCKAENPGGLCDDPTGQGNCTYSVEDAGEIDIDELVGIAPKFRSREEYCWSGCKEGDPLVETCFGEQYAYDPNPRCGNFWDNIWDPLRNELRVQKALDAFRKKYPESPPHEEMLPPPCDFSQSRYGYFSR